MSFSPLAEDVIATTRNGALLKWDLPSALSLKDMELASFAYSVLPLAVDIAGRSELSSGSGLSQIGANCGFKVPGALGLPPHRLTGSSKARKLLTIPETCSAYLGQKGAFFLKGRIAEAQGDYERARREYMAALQKEGDNNALVGLGDLAFLHGVGSVADAEHFYTAAADAGVSVANSRLGWLLIDDRLKAEQHFKNAADRADADGHTGLGWLEEQRDDTSVDIAAAFRNFVWAQQLYQRAGALEQAKSVAERRAFLAYLIASAEAVETFVRARGEISDLATTGRRVP
jgi:tetratricopeptide (TPR) repeat protein